MNCCRTETELCTQGTVAYLIICPVSLYFVTDIRAVGGKGGREAVLWVNTGLEIINISNQNKQISIISVSLPRATAVTNSASFSNPPPPPRLVMISGFLRKGNLSSVISPQSWSYQPRCAITTAANSGRAWSQASA